ncbi:hypothetical protein [Microcoleus sp.]|uniref:hypothetical protein n=1 Tax=Microcoleus sp. TaxID=44472 RepID=UPI0035936F57
MRYENLGNVSLGRMNTKETGFFTKRRLSLAYLHYQAEPGNEQEETEFFTYFT